jgi:hypothetical protein
MKAIYIVQLLLSAFYLADVAVIGWIGSPILGIGFVGLTIVFIGASIEMQLVAYLGRHFWKWWKGRNNSEVSP